MSGKSYVAFIDILGFKDLVNNNTHEELEKIYKKSFEINLQLSLSNGLYKIVKDNQDKNITVADISNSKINSLMISDSIILWTDNISMKNFIDMLIVVRNLLNNGFIFGTPLRGAISLGNLSFLQTDITSEIKYVQNSLIGKGLIKAYLIESGQNWAGCIIDSDCIENYQFQFNQIDDKKDIADIEYLEQKNVLIKYNVPYKTGEIKENYVVNWFRNDAVDEKLIRNSFKQHNKNINNWDVENKIKNTLEFYSFARDCIKQKEIERWERAAAEASKDKDYMNFVEEISDAGDIYEY